MIVEISRRRVLEILRKEKLTHMTYAGHPSGNLALASAKGCSFCAVGQVVRACLPRTALTTQVEAASLDALDSRGSMLYGLEGAFEQDFTNDPDGEKGRARAIAYVKSHFPARVRIDIGDAKPRRGMKIVVQ